MAERNRRRRRRKQNQAAPPGISQSRQAASVEERLETWRTRVGIAQRIRRDWEHRYQVRLLEEFYYGRQTHGDDESYETWINLFYANIQTMLPGLLFQAPTFHASSMPGKQPFDRQQAKIFESLLQAIAAQDDNLVTDGGLAVLQSFFRIGVLKVCYDPIFERNPRAGEKMMRDTDDGQTPLLDDGGVEIIEPDEILTDEVYAWEWVDACNMLLPDEGPNQRKWTWIGEEVELTMDEAQDDPRFPKRLRDQFVANATANPDSPDRSIAPEHTGTARDREHERFRYIELWDIRNKQHLAYAEGQPFKEWLIDEDTPGGTEDHPYALLLHHPQVGKNTSPWPMPVAYNWLPLQREYNNVRLQQIAAGKRAARKVLYEENAFPDDEEARKALESSRDMEAVAVTDITRPPLLFADSSISADVTRSINSLLFDWRQTTGVTGTRLGDADSGDTATEASFAERAASLRDSLSKSKVRTWLARAGKKMVQKVRQTLTYDIWTQIKGFSDKEFQEFVKTQEFQFKILTRFGPELAPIVMQALLDPSEQFSKFREDFKEQFGSEKPLRVTRSMLDFEADITVEPGSVQPRNTDVERAQMIQMLQVGGSIIGPAMLSPTLLEELFSTFNIPNRDRIVDEIMANLRQMQQAQAQQQQAKGAAGTNGAQVVPGGGTVTPQLTAAGVLRGQ